MAASEIFSRVARRRQRERAAKSAAQPSWIAEAMSAMLLERAEEFCKPGQRVLLVGLLGTGKLRHMLNAMGVTLYCADAGFHFARDCGGAQIDEDRLPFADGSFDAILFCGLLDTVNDLPGAFILSRRILKPGGVLVACFLSAPSLEGARASVAMIDSDMGGGVAARFHPQFDLRVAGDLLLRAGFSNPVTDVDRLLRTYDSLGALIEELGAAGLRNTLATRHRVTREWLARAKEARPIEECFTLLNAVAWKDAGPA